MEINARIHKLSRYHFNNLRTQNLKEYKTDNHEIKQVHPHHPHRYSHQL
jgi:hypothetical protein